MVVTSDAVTRPEVKPFIWFINVAVIEVSDKVIASLPNPLIPLALYKVSTSAAAPVNVVTVFASMVLRLKRQI